MFICSFHKYLDSSTDLKLSCELELLIENFVLNYTNLQILIFAIDVLIHCLKRTVF